MLYYVAYDWRKFAQGLSTDDMVFTRDLAKFKEAIKPDYSRFLDWKVVDRALDETQQPGYVKERALVFLKRFEFHKTGKMGTLERYGIRIYEEKPF